jgi:hypothetical protein
MFIPVSTLRYTKYTLSPSPSYRQSYLIPSHYSMDVKVNNKLIKGQYPKLFFRFRECLIVRYRSKNERIRSTTGNEYVGPRLISPRTCTKLTFVIVHKDFWLIENFSSSSNLAGNPLDTTAILYIIRLSKPASLLFNLHRFSRLSTE